MISELITFRITKVKAKVDFRARYIRKHECKRSSVPINFNTRAKATKHLGQINFTLICVATVRLPFVMQYASHLYRSTLRKYRCLGSLSGHKLVASARPA